MNDCNQATWSIALFLPTGCRRSRKGSNRGVSTPLSVCQMRGYSLNDGSLRAVHHTIAPDNVTVPVICPELIGRVLDRLPKLWSLKPSAGGTYRLLLLTNYALLNIGVNVKHVGEAGDDHLAMYHSTCVPLGFAIASAESEESYGPLLEAVMRVSERISPNFSLSSVLRLHGDLRKGLKKARRSGLPGAKRLSDWAHVVGATAQGPGGLPGLIMKHIQVEGVRRFLSRWLYLSRCTGEPLPRSVECHLRDAPGPERFLGGPLLAQCPAQAAAPQEGHDPV